MVRPLWVNQGLKMLGDLQSRSSKSQLKARAVAFADVAAFVNRCGAVGGCPPCGYNFYNSLNKKGGMRVDIVIYSGQPPFWAP